MWNIQWGDAAFELAPHIERDFSAQVKFPCLWQLTHTGWCWVTLQEEWRSSLMFAGRLVKARDVLVLSAGLRFTVHHWQDHWSYYDRLCEKGPSFFFNITWVKCVNNICFFQKKDFPMFLWSWWMSSRLLAYSFLFWRGFHLFIALETQTLLTFLKGRFSNAVTYVTFLMKTWLQRFFKDLRLVLNNLRPDVSLALTHLRLYLDLTYEIKW